MWFVHEMAPRSPAYNVSLGARFERFDIPAVQRSLKALTARHEMLRSRYALENGEPVALIGASLEVPIDEVDASGHGPEGLDQMIRAASEAPFDLASGPLIRAAVFHTGDQDVLLITVHHIAFDGWSSSILLKDLLVIYAAEREGRRADLESLEARYADYVRWLDDRLASPEGADLLRFWESYLAGPLPTLDLPADRPRPAVVSYRGQSHAFTIETELAEVVRATARAHKVTPFVLLYSVFTALLARYTGQEDILLGSPTAGRSHPRFRNVVGYFVNPVVLRAAVDTADTFADHLATCGKAVIAALEHADLPFPALVRRLNPKRDASRSPLFDVDFNFIKLQLRRGAALAPKGPVVRLSGAGLEMDLVLVGQQEGQFDLAMELYDTGNHIVGYLNFAADLFERGRIARMAGHYEQLLRSAVADVGTPLGRLSMLTAEEQSEARRWNETARTWPAVTVPEAVAAQARRTPNQSALVFEGTTVTYAEMDRRASALAARLVAVGAGRGVLVAVLAERSLDLVTAVLAVLKAGAAYVPMDPTFPAERLAYMIGDSGASILLTQGPLASAVPTSARVILIEAGEPNDHPGVVTQPDLDDLAYVIYTSGSTGKPKGVPITHRSLTNLLFSMREEPGFGDADTLLAVTTLSFDIAALELYVPLISGGTVVVASRDEVSDARALGERLTSSGATVMQATPATWRGLLDSGWPGNPHLRALCGGEALPRDLADALLDRVSELWNMYGPTETTIWSSVWRVEAGQNISIGRPVANTSMYVLDSSGQIAPRGVPGELCIGGAGLSPGYWRRDDLTAERFVESATVGERLYKTGDQARWLDDGRLEWLSRLDQQVKVRGYRIELEEIEIALRDHPHVESTVVVAQAAAGGDQRLVAFLTGGTQPNVTELRNHLKKTLPGYMIPSSFVSLDRLPTTPNGKVDRKALSVWQSAAASLSESRPPQTPVEKYLAGLWCEVIGIPKVGLDDNFFDVGGHSLLAMRVLVAVEKRTGVHLHPRDIIFQNLGQLAAACGELPAERVADAASSPANAGGWRNALRSIISRRS